MNSLRVHMFGKLRVYCGEELIEKLPTVKCRDLFCFLLLHRRARHSRDVIAGLFWSDVPEERARRSLRTTLWRLRALLEPETNDRGKYFLIDNGDIGFNLSSDYWLDVEEFEKCIGSSVNRNVAELDDQWLAAVTRAASLYQGDMLEGCLEDWCIRERERLKDMYLDALTCLMLHHQHRGEYQQAIALGKRILNSDGLLEEVHRELIWVYWITGNRSAALKQYRTCASILKKELGIEPIEETERLYGLICNRDSRPNDRFRGAEPHTALEISEGNASLDEEDRLLLALRRERAIRQLRRVRNDLHRLTVHLDRAVEALESELRAEASSQDQAPVPVTRR